MAAKRSDDEEVRNLLLALDAWRVQPHSAPACKALGEAFRALLVPTLPRSWDGITRYELDAICQYLRGPVGWAGPGRRAGGAA